MANSSVGPSKPEPCPVAMTPGIGFKSIISAGDEVIGATNPDGTARRFVGIPDGIDGFDDGGGTATVLVNHAIGAADGVVREHGSIGSVDTQAHHPFGAPGSSGRIEIAQGGQPMLMRVDADAAFA